jgi:nucleoside-diphosphate-sugar epimerase
MNVVTGATGFLGREIVRSLARQGAEPIRCLVRPGTAPERLAGLAGARVEAVPVHLDDRAALARALAGARAVFHAAAVKRGAPAALVAGTVVPTEHLLHAARAARVGRVVLVSSFSVIGVARLRRGGLVDEEAPLDPHPEARDAYAFAKHRQETLAWRLAEELGLALAVIRPGMIFGPGQALLGSRLGLGLGPIFLALGGRCTLPLTYVENCADAVALAGSAPDAAGRALCVVDDDLPTAGAVLARYRREVERLAAVPVPYPLLLLLARLNAWYSARTDGHLPPVLTPYKVKSLWRPQRYSNRRARAVLGWSPRVPMAEALARTFRALSVLPAPAAIPPRRTPRQGPSAPAEARA